MSTLLKKFFLHYSNSTIQKKIYTLFNQQIPYYSKKKFHYSKKKLHY